MFWNHSPQFNIFNCLDPRTNHQNQTSDKQGLCCRTSSLYPKLHPPTIPGQQSKKREAVTGISVPFAKSKTLAFALARRPMDRVDLARLVNKVTPSLRLVALDGLTDASNVGTIVWPDGGEGDYGWTWWEGGRSDLVMN
jgi:hypothetical protein